jgi:cephalosporin hydroxylase
MAVADLFSANRARRNVSQPTEEMPRDFHTALAPHNLQSIQVGLHRYSWKGIPMWKNPFDFAIYWLLVWYAKPRTIIEIGSKFGGSAIWFADMLQSYGVNDGKVVSIDINPVTTIIDPRIDFLYGDASNLGATLASEYLEHLPRPWLIIEDSSHIYEHCLAVLKFFHPRIRKGEFLVVEDGIIDDLGISGDYNGGPNRAVREFIAEHGQDYALATELCDFWGLNITWNPNGYWKKIV